MLKQLTAAAAAVIAFLTFCGYMALSAYLTAFGLDRHVTAFGQYGYVHYGLLMLDQNGASVPFFVLIGILIAIVYGRYIAASSAVPYETVTVSRRRIGFWQYLTGGFGDARSRQTRAILSDVFLVLLTVAIFFSGALMGERLGSKMADDAVNGTSIVANPDVHVQQTFYLHVHPGVHLNAQIAAANAHHQLGIVWEDDQSIAVLRIGQHLRGPKATLDATTIYKSDISSVDTARTFIIPQRKHIVQKPPSALDNALAYSPLLIALAFVIWVLAIAYGSYLSVANVEAEIAPLSQAEAVLRQRHPYTERVAYAIKHGKDVRVFSEENGTHSVTYVRNSAFDKGFRMTWTPEYENYSAAIRAKVDEMTNSNDPPRTDP